ncbi:MATE family efflux transporter [Anaerococcus sp. Marseille-P3625]|uniref:MATE family efflux transporter n=1 Tax=Anaerococcus sp. Marseille-P3625 TaxID=1977277 RepID=UPI000C071850|nr:MATE family efflux transporter [Anaerococcus sp. Marseille-P3625]
MNQNTNLTKGDISKSLFKLSIPLALTAFIQITYNFVDIFFLGRLGKDAIAGVGIAGFLFWIANAITLIPKIGTGVYASHAFGRSDDRETIKVLNNGYILTITISVFYSLLLFLFSNYYVNFYGLTESASAYARDYLHIISFGMIFFFINPVLSQSFQSLGNSLTPFKINTIGLITNIIIDPILIFGYGPIPRLEAKGAALATVMAQIVVTLIFVFNIFRKNKILKSAISSFHYKRAWVISIFKMGFPAALMSSFMATISIILNKFMADFGEAAVAAYTVGSQLEAITWNTTEGLQVGIAAMVGQNYGAGLMERVKESIKKSFVILLVIGTISMLVLFAFRYQLFKLFIPNDKETIELGAIYLAILSFSQIFMSTEIGLTGAFNGLGDTKTPAIIGMVSDFSRIPISKIFMPIFGVAGVWLAMSLTSVAKGLLVVFMLVKKMKKSIK